MIKTLRLRASAFETRRIAEQSVAEVKLAKLRSGKQIHLLENSYICTRNLCKIMEIKTIIKRESLCRMLGESPLNTPVALALDIVLAFALFMLCRLVFLAVNFGYYADHLTLGLLESMLRGGLLFDASAVVYVNALYILMMLLPWKGKERRGYQTAAKVVFVLFNGVAAAANLADCVYFRFTGRRTTATLFSEFGNEGNLGSIIGTEVLNHWYLTLLFLLLMWGVWRLYRRPAVQLTVRRPALYYTVQTLCLLVAVPLCIFAIRGGIGKAVRPITLSNANQYINRPVEAAVVLNTPFSIIRTIGKKPFEVPAYLSTEEMEAAYSPIHHPTGKGAGRGAAKKNVVIFIMESFGREYIGALNRSLDANTYKGYTPFLDSLIPHSYVFTNAVGNGRKSIDGMPSVLSGIPMFVEPFFVTPAALNKVSGIAGELQQAGYHTAFFHGAENGSMGFQAFARATGFKEYYGRTEYNADPHTGGDADFDGTWAIWDEEFFRFMCDKLSSFRQPFAAALFSASSHHPFAVPERYRERFPEEGGKPIHKCIRYSDNALRLFFEQAARQPWFDNTLFVITADHTNQTSHAEYQTDYGGFAVPIIFYDPGAGLRGCSRAIAQQTDIMPTVLGYLGYDRPFLAFGNDLFNTPDHRRFAVNYLNGIYQYFQGDYVIQFDGSSVTAIYDYRNDPLQQHNIIHRIQPQKQMELQLKAIIQQYMLRMNEDRLTPDTHP